MASANVNFRAGRDDDGLVGVENPVVWMLTQRSLQLHIIFPQDLIAADVFVRATCTWIL